MAWCGFAACCAPRPDGVSGEPLAFRQATEPKDFNCHSPLAGRAGKAEPFRGGEIYSRPRAAPPQDFLSREFLAFLKAHRIPYDERYIWE